MPLLHLDNVSKHYGKLNGDPPGVEILKGVSLAVAGDESVAIVGPSGSGKSTLLNLIGMLDRPSSGRILLDGDDLGGLDDKQLAQRRNQFVGFVFQSHHLLPQCIALENVLIPTLAGNPVDTPDQSAQRARRLLEQVGLSDRSTHRPGQLSGGECQRVALVRALINRPRLVLADEPTGSLDEAASGQIAALLVQLNQSENVALIVVTHAQRLAERMQRKLILHDGVLQEQSV